MVTVVMIAHARETLNIVVVVAVLDGVDESMEQVAFISDNTRITGHDANSFLH